MTCQDSGTIRSAGKADIENRFRNLMIAVQAGDRTATNLLLRQAGIWLHNYYRMRLAPEERDDLVQETLLALYLARTTWNSERPFLPWLAGIARRRWMGHLRKLYSFHRRASVTEANGRDLISFGVTEGDAVLDRLSLERLLQTVSHRQAEAIRLVKIEGFTVREASGMTGQSESLIKVNIHRGLHEMSALAATDEVGRVASR
ncbi:sigma factor [Erythrobacter donghaensis]|uniref:sigma factor n=1 Tax=Erythrobacter donghaensis TaxID=267135 RepID=UPI000AD2C536|nr:sigma factor [Erythrobacter donghaensis]